MFDLIFVVRRERLQMLHHVVVFVFGLQHEQDLLQVLQVDVLRTLGGTQHADDAFGDVGQVGSLRLLHGRGAGKENPAGQQMFADCLSARVSYCRQQISDSGSAQAADLISKSFFMGRNAETKCGREEGKEEAKQKRSHGNLPDLVMMSQASPNSSPQLFCSVLLSFLMAQEKMAPSDLHPWARLCVHVSPRSCDHCVSNQ